MIYIVTTITEEESFQKKEWFRTYNTELRIPGEPIKIFKNTYVDIGDMRVYIKSTVKDRLGNYNIFASFPSDSVIFFNEYV